MLNNFEFNYWTINTWKEKLVWSYEKQTILIKAIWLSILTNIPHIPLYKFIQGGVWLSKWCKIQHFKILFIFNIYSFIFDICIYSALLFVQTSTPIFIINSYICSQNYYPFRNYLSIQQLFIHSRFTAHLSYAWKWRLPAADEQGAAKKRKPSFELWKDTDRFCTEFSEKRLRRSEHLRLCLTTLRRCSINFCKYFSRAPNQRKMQRSAVHNQKN